MIQLPAFAALSLGNKLALAGALCAVCVLAYWSWHNTVWQKGYDAAIARIAAQDKEAVDAADKARLRVQRCRALGRVWDISAGVCR